MPSLTIDSRPVTVPDGSTVLDAARALGIDIPALCQYDGCNANTSCLCCLVRINGGKRLVPSCATKVVDGMAIESETPDIHAARKTSLELLLADHAGDCRGPCTNVCPAHMDIPSMIGHIEAGRLHDALLVVKEHIALPAVLGRICPELCEKGCRRGQLDTAVSICRLKRYVADVDLESGKPWMPPCRESSGKRVAIVGSGPAGLAAAWYLQQFGHACTLIDQQPEPGGNLRYAVDPVKLPHNVLDAEIDLVRRLGATFQQKTAIGKDVSIAELKQQYGTVLIAVGEVDAARAQAMGLALVGKGLKVDRDTMRTNVGDVFAAGAAVTPYRHAIRAVADGRSAAHMIDQHLRGLLPQHEGKFTVRLGVLSDAEMATIMAGVSRDGRTAVPNLAAFTDPQARAESSRCMHCECAKQYDCDLRKYAQTYDANVNEYKMPRRPFTRIETHNIVYEQGKCISCGICVGIANREKETLGLTFVGRGFDVRVGVPFNRELSDALKKVAEECAEACPTAALAKKQARRQE
ncbi:MAG: FAD-dependent oxidoreductase [Tepidisphaerales bacterium]